MKKKIAKLLVLIMAAGTILSGCGSDAGNETGYEAADAVTVLSDVWEAYAEEEKFFAMGGDFNNPVDNAPGKFDAALTEDMDYMLAIPADAAAMVDDAASLLHAMNQNTFTAGAFHVTDDVAAFTEAVKENVLNRQWMCGFPDELTIATVNGDYVVVAFGAADLMSVFEGHLQTVTGAELVVEENLAE